MNVLSVRYPVPSAQAVPDQLRSFAPETRRALALSALQYPVPATCARPSAVLGAGGAAAGGAVTSVPSIKGTRVMVVVFSLACLLHPGDFRARQTPVNPFGVKGRKRPDGCSSYPLVTGTQCPGPGKTRESAGAMVPGLACAQRLCSWPSVYGASDHAQLPGCFGKDAETQRHHGPRCYVPAPTSEPSGCSAGQPLGSVGRASFSPSTRRG